MREREVLITHNIARSTVLGSDLPERMYGGINDKNTHFDGEQYVSDGPYEPIIRRPQRKASPFIIKIA